MNASRRQHALIIGINTYTAMPERSLRGCVNDAELMQSLVIEQFGFATDDVELLCDAAATRDGVLAAFERLDARVGPDDGVLIFYAGHGSRIQLPDGRFGEGLVTSDSGRGALPNRDIADVELDAFIQRLNAKTPWITLIFDCCHSGSVTREDAGVRQVAPDERIQPEVLARFQAPRSAKGQAFVTGQRRAVLLAACRADELAREGRDPATGRPHGALTIALAGVLANLRGRATWAEVIGAIAPRLSARHPRQHPLLEGRVDTAVFGFEHRDHAQALSVLARSGDQVTLSGGAVHGLTVGSAWRLVPTVTDGAPEIVTITSVTGVRAKATGARAAQIGWRAVAEEQALPAPTLGVCVAAGAPASLSAQIAQSPLLALETADAAEVTVRRVDETLQAIGADGHFATRAQSLGAMADLVADLERLARYQALLTMPFTDQNQALADSVTFEVLAPAPAAGGLQHIEAGERFDVRLRNLGDTTVYVSIVEFGLDRSIGLLLPHAAHLNHTPGGFPLEAGETVHVAADYYAIDPAFGDDMVNGLTMGLPDGFPWAAEPGEQRAMGLLTYRALITRAPASFAFLAQGGSRKVGGHPLQTRLGHARFGTRSGIPTLARSAPEPYAVHSVTVAVGPEGSRQISPDSGGAPQGHQVYFYKVRVGGSIKGEVGITHPAMSTLAKDAAYWRWFPSSWPTSFELEPEAMVSESSAILRVSGVPRQTTSPRFSTSMSALSLPSNLDRAWKVTNQSGVFVAWLAKTVGKSGALFWYTTRPDCKGAWLPPGLLKFTESTPPTGTMVYTATDV